MKHNSVEDTLKKLNSIILQQDECLIADTLIDLFLSPEAFNGENNVSICIFDKLLDYMQSQMSNMNKISYLILLQLLLRADRLSVYQYEKLKSFLSENYPKFVENSCSFLIAEWVGGFRNQWALDVISHWMSLSLSNNALGNLTSALDEFLYDNDINPTSKELKLEAKSLLSIVRKNIEKR